MFLTVAHASACWSELQLAPARSWAEAHDSVLKRAPQNVERELGALAHLVCRMPRRRLPHIYPEGGWLFVTWHLPGSLPRALYPPPGKASAGKAFLWMDRYLDTARHGPMFLRLPEVAQLVVDKLERGRETGLYDLRAFVVMSDHVHVLFRPRENGSAALQWLKGTTAREANKVLARTGKPFWQRESYDHCVRTERQLERIVGYIENNPVKAGLVAEASQYPWSSAAKTVN